MLEWSKRLHPWQPPTAPIADLGLLLTGIVCCRDYVALANAMSNGDGRAWATRVHTEEELVEALKTATGEKANQ